MSFADVLTAKPKEPELYRILGCDEKSTTDQITAEYRARVRDLHPDKNTSDKSEEATEKFVELQNAYSVLTDDSRRKDYDTWLHSPIPVSFEEFSKSKDTFQMSTHWAVPKTQPAIEIFESKERETTENEREFTEHELTSPRWAESDRYKSSAAVAFRTYRL